MSATITDVARAAGVSPSTVSRALSGGPVNDVTRTAILRVAEDLGYRPNRAARELITGRTGSIGLLVPDLGNPYFSEIIKGASARHAPAPFPIFVSDTDEDVAREREAIASLRATTDGLIVVSPRGSDEELAALADGGPTVVVNREVPGLPAVVADAASGIGQALQHLSALGHSRVAYVTGPQQSWSDRRRREGLGTAPGLGIEIVEVPTATPTFHSGVLAADVVLATGATAVIAFNDLIAIGVLDRLTARGVRVPIDISVVGHDDIAMASMCTPHLTTIAVPKERMGSMAADMLLRTLDRRGAADDRDPALVLPSTLIVRDSTGEAKA